MSRLEIGTFTPLSLDLDRLPDLEIHEYAIKKPFLTASVVFTFEKEEGAGYVSDALLEARVPFKGDFVYRASSDLIGLVGSGNVAAFGRYSEQQDEVGSRTWYAESETLKLVRDGHPDAEPQRVSPMPPVVDLPASLLNPILLLSVLNTEAVDKNKKCLVTQFVTMRKICGVKLERTDIGDWFQIFTKELDTPIGTLEEWTKIEWPDKETLSVKWDPSGEVVRSFRVSLPVLGAVEIPLFQHTRE